MQLSGADIVVRTLIEQGCKVVFGYPGGQIIDVYDSLYKYRDEIEHVLTAHEQGAVHAADGYSRASGRPGVVMATGVPSYVSRFTEPSSHTVATISLPSAASPFCSNTS